MGANSCIDANAGSDLLSSATRRSQRGGHPAPPSSEGFGCTRMQWGMVVAKMPLAKTGIRGRLVLSGDRPACSCNGMRHLLVKRPRHHKGINTG
jgi:hypothetical protein